MVKSSERGHEMFIQTTSRGSNVMKSISKISSRNSPDNASAEFMIRSRVGNDNIGLKEYEKPNMRPQDKFMNKTPRKEISPNRAN
jgi:hypothetical protein